ncbi:hypothetical protein [Anaerobranca gottschalkii]|uniref:Uncharacterized protein n=1 Tax=Anaerobranca gottschalkii DSM 13577 TaxID=1120990 RepID=A0A1H9YTZ3_9FIRM|nr:hypothetical protein [Anaerobranca gottschalkii]SES72538.1 hypothetical protein SAMN03080614_100512 [Anaerobranca gottschalkii DSM 13577]
MLEIYDIFGNQLGLIVGEYEKELLVWLGQHSIEELPRECFDFDQIELKCAKNMHLVNKEQKFDKKFLYEKLKIWWLNRYPHLDFSYYLAVTYYNLSKRDWTGINIFETIEKGVFILLSYKYLTPRKQLTLARGDFPKELEEGKYLACEVSDHPHVVTFDKTKLWDNTKKESGIYTQLSLKSVDKIIYRKLPYFIYAKKGDKLLLEITDNDKVPSVFVNGIKYSFIQ